jgi:transcriptional regulator with XRE-family HTH domain
MDSSEYKLVGKYLKELRKQANLSQREIAEHLSTHRSIISFIENGERQPKKPSIYTLISFYIHEIKTHEIQNKKKLEAQMKIDTELQSCFLNLDQIAESLSCVTEKV